MRRTILLPLMLALAGMVFCGPGSVHAQEPPEAETPAEEAIEDVIDQTVDESLDLPEPAPDAPIDPADSAPPPDLASPELPTDPVQFPELSEDLQRATELSLPTDISPSDSLLDDIADPAPVPERGPATQPPAGGLPTRNYAITGNRYIIDRILRETASSYMVRPTGSNLTAAGVDDAAFGIQQLYHQRGFPDAAVTWRLTQGGGQVVFAVDEGPQVQLGEIQLFGNETFPQEDLEPYFKRATRKRVDEFSALFNRLGDEDLPYVREDVERGAKEIRNYYINEGFFDVVVSEPEVNIINSRANVTVEISEGPRYTLGNITFIGNENYDDTELLEAITQGDDLPLYFNQRFVLETESRLTEFYNKRGYFSATVASRHDDITRADQSVDVTFAISSGAIFYVTDLRVSGADDLRPEYFERMIKPVMGKRYEPEEIRDIYTELVNTGLFRNLQMEPYVVESDPNNPGRLGLNVEVEEAADLLFSVYAGYSSFEGPIGGVRADDLNLFGMGRSLTGRTDISGIGINGEIIFKDPWLLGRERNFELSLQAQTREYDGYRRQSADLTARGIWPIDEHITLTGEVGGQTADIEPLRLPVELLGPTNYRTVRTGISADFDYRNDIFLPSRGWRALGGFEYFSSEQEHMRSNLRASLHLPFDDARKHVLSFGGQINAIFGVDDVLDLPIDQRLFNGGPNSVRSFRTRELGPVHEGSGSPTGGLFKSAYTIEYTYRVSDSIRLAAFTDAGNNLPELSGNLLENMRYAIGLGFRLDLPVGPLRIDYGYNPNPTIHEKTGALHITFGAAF